MSFPSRERGLKFYLKLVNLNTVVVVPFAGTWIEILSLKGADGGKGSFPSRERGLKCRYRTDGSKI